MFRPRAVRLVPETLGAEFGSKCRCGRQRGSVKASFNQSLTQNYMTGGGSNQCVSPNAGKQIQAKQNIEPKEKKEKLETCNILTKTNGHTDFIGRSVNKDQVKLLRVGQPITEEGDSQRQEV